LHQHSAAGFDPDPCPILECRGGAIADREAASNIEGRITATRIGVDDLEGGSPESILTVPAAPLKLKSLNVDPPPVASNAEVVAAKLMFAVVPGLNVKPAALFKVTPASIVICAV
jgi:hypothetical protein